MRETQNWECRRFWSVSSASSASLSVQPTLTSGGRDRLTKPSLARRRPGPTDGLTSCCQPSNAIHKLRAQPNVHQITQASAPHNVSYCMLSQAADQCYKALLHEKVSLQKPCLQEYVSQPRLVIMVRFSQ